MWMVHRAQGHSLPLWERFPAASPTGDQKAAEFAEASSRAYVGPSLAWLQSPAAAAPELPAHSADRLLPMGAQEVHVSSPPRRPFGGLCFFFPSCPFPQKLLNQPPTHIEGMFTSKVPLA